jgi:hypothetical protein
LLTSFFFISFSLHFVHARIQVEYLFAGEVGQTQQVLSSYFIAKFDLRCELVSWLTDLVCVTLNLRNSGEPILFFYFLHVFCLQLKFVQICCSNV